MNEKSYADRLGDQLEIILSAPAMELEDILARLNASGLHPHSGDSWTPDSFVAELKRLGE